MAQQGKQQKSIEQLEKERKRRPLIVGAVIIGFGLIFGILCKEWAITAVCVGIGVATMALLLLKIRHEDRQLVPGTDEYEKEQQRLRNDVEAARKKLYVHKTLHDEVSFYPMMISGAVLGVLTAIDLGLILFGGVIYYLLVILNICMIGVFIYTLMGKEYKTLLINFASKGLDERAAEADFAGAAMVREGSDILSVSDRFIINTSQKKCSLIDTSAITWVFGRITYTYNYYNGIYTGRTENHILVFCTSDGGYFEAKVPRGGMYAMLGELSGKGIICGYSNDLYSLYSSSPAAFAENASAAEFPMPSPDDILMPEKKDQ